MVDHACTDSLNLHSLRNCVAPRGLLSLSNSQHVGVAVPPSLPLLSVRSTSFCGVYFVPGVPPSTQLAFVRVVHLPFRGRVCFPPVSALFPSFCDSCWLCPTLPPKNCPEQYVCCLIDRAEFSSLRALSFSPHFGHCVHACSLQLPN